MKNNGQMEFDFQEIEKKLNAKLHSASEKTTGTILEVLKQIKKT